MASIQMIRSAPHQFTKLAAPWRSVKGAFKVLPRSTYPRAIPGESVVARVPLLSKHIKVTVTRPSIEVLSTPSLFQPTPTRVSLASFPRGSTFFARWMAIA